VLPKDEDVEGCGNEVRMLREGGGIICVDKEVGRGVVTFDDVAWLY